MQPPPNNIWDTHGDCGTGIVVSLSLETCLQGEGVLHSARNRRSMNGGCNTNENRGGKNGALSNTHSHKRISRNKA